MFLFCTNQTDNSKQKFTVKIDEGSKDAEFLVDTESGRTIIEKSVLKKTMRAFSSQKTDTLLRSYSGEKLDS